MEVVTRIKHEAEQGTQVLGHLFQLVDAHGTRITNAKGFHDSAEWAKQQLEAWGLEWAKQQLEAWGLDNAVLKASAAFSCGWSRQYFSAHLPSIGHEQIIGVPRQAGEASRHSGPKYLPSALGP